MDSFEALGRLNEAAVAGHRRDPHDGAARLAGGGAGGLYRRLSEGREPDGAVTWLSKPAGTSYADFLGRMPAGVELWQRQMVLGPAPEFCLAQAAAPGALGGVGLAQAAAPGALGGVGLAVERVR